MQAPLGSSHPLHAQLSANLALVGLSTDGLKADLMQCLFQATQTEGASKDLTDVPANPDAMIPK